MKYVEFIDCVKCELESRFEGKYRFDEANVLKNNGTVRQGINVVSENTNLHPCIYLEEYFAAYMNDVKLEKLIEDIVEKVEECVVEQNVDVNFIMDWEKIKNHVYCRVINTDANEELLKKVPNREFLDMSVVYHIEMESVPVFDKHDTVTVLIHNEQMACWGIDEEYLYMVAINNMKDKKTAAFDKMRDILFRLMPELSEEEIVETVPLYVLGNKRGIYGAAEILVKETLDSIAMLLEDDFIVLPSSTHETIIVSCSVEDNVEEMAKLVREVNDTQVKAEEILSYHVYRYYRKDSCLRIVA